MPAEPNTAGLTAAARTRHELTRAKAVKALHDLQRQGVPVTFGVVAATAGVSRSWLYRQAGLRQQIGQLRQTEPAPASHAADGATQSSGASGTAGTPEPGAGTQSAARRRQRPAAPPTRPSTRRATPATPAGCAAALLPSRFHNDRTLLTVAYAATAVTSTTPSST